MVLMTRFNEAAPGVAVKNSGCALNEADDGDGRIILAAS